MSIPIISLEDATSIWSDRMQNEKFDHKQITIDSIGEGTCITDFELDLLVGQLRKVMKGGGSGGEVDSQITEIVHSKLSVIADVSQLSHIGFWRWLSNVASDGFFSEFIMWRLNSKKSINWGVTSQNRIVEVYFYRAWLRGHKMYDPTESDPYKYSKIGSSDVWRSHILRQDFGKDREFVKAFLDSVYSSKGKTVIQTKELRERVIPALRAWTSGSTFTHLSYKENLELIQKLREDGI